VEVFELASWRVGRAIGKFRSRKNPRIRARPQTRRHLKIRELANSEIGAAERARCNGEWFGEFSIFGMPRRFRAEAENSPTRKSEQLSGRGVTGSGVASSRFLGCRRAREWRSFALPRSVPRGTDLKKRFKIRFLNLVPVLVRGRRPLDGHLKALLTDPLPREKDPQLCLQINLLCFS